MMAETQGNTLVSGSIWKQMLKFFAPVWAGMLFQQLYATVDAVIVGRFVDIDALAAVGATGVLVNLLVGFFVGLSSGATVLISQYYGAGDRRQVSRGVHTAITLAVVGGVLVMVLGLALSRWALVKMNTPADILEEAVLYIRVYFTGMVPMFIYNMGAGVLRALGDAKRPLYFLIVASVVNILLDFLFIAGFGMGVAGAAWATVVSQVASAVLVLVVLSRAEGECWQLHWQKLRTYPNIMAGVLRVGVPTGFESVLYTVSNIIIQASINSFGTDTVAAWTVSSKIDSVFGMTLQAIGVAVTTLAGQNFGAKKYDRVKKTTWVGLGMGVITSVVMTALLVTFADPLYHIFTADETVITIGVSIIRFLIPTYITFVPVQMLSGVFRGVGDSLTTTVIVCFGTCVLRVIWFMTAVPASHTMTTVMLAYPVSWVVTSIIEFVYYFSGVWLKKSIRRQEREFVRLTD